MHTATEIAARTAHLTGFDRAAAFRALAAETIETIKSGRLSTTDLLAAVDRYHWFDRQAAEAARTA